MADIECHVCLMPYDDAMHKPVIGVCGHSVCKDCRKRLVAYKCPDCRRAKAFKKEVVNFALQAIVSVSRKPPVCHDGCGNRTTGRSRVCVTCLPFPRPEPGSEDHLSADQVSPFRICGDCLLDKHSNHEVKVFHDYEDDTANYAVGKYFQALATKIENGELDIQELAEARRAQKRETEGTYIARELFDFVEHLQKKNAEAIKGFAKILTTADGLRGENVMKRISLLKRTATPMSNRATRSTPYVVPDHRERRRRPRSQAGSR